MKVITIGRGQENNDIVVDDVKVSRHHLQMIRDDQGHYFAIDLESTNGTYINGQRITGKIELKSNDIVKIGDTVLPWQNYFIMVFEAETSEDKAKIPQNKKHRILYVAIILVLLFMIGGAIFIIAYTKETEKTLKISEQEIREETEKATKRSMAHLELAKASEEYERAKRTAAESQSKKNLEYAEKMRQEMLQKQSMAEDNARKAAQYRQEKYQAIQSQKKAEEETQKAEMAKLEAEKQVKKAQELVDEAKKAQKEAEESVLQTREFYKIFGALKKDVLLTICDSLNYNNVEGCDLKEVVEKKFTEADNAERQKIIKTIQEVSNQQSKDYEKNMELTTQLDLLLKDDSIEDECWLIVCQKLSDGFSENQDKKAFVKEKFEKADIIQKEDIIAMIQKVNLAQSQKRKENQSVVKSVNTKASNE